MFTKTSTAIHTLDDNKGSPKHVLLRVPVLSTTYAKSRL